MDYKLIDVIAGRVGDATSASFGDFKVSLTFENSDGKRKVVSQVLPCNAPMERSFRDLDMFSR